MLQLRRMDVLATLTNEVECIEEHLIDALLYLQFCIVKLGVLQLCCSFIYCWFIQTTTTYCCLWCRNVYNGNVCEHHGSGSFEKSYCRCLVFSLLTPSSYQPQSLQGAAECCGDGHHYAGVLIGDYIQGLWLRHCSRSHGSCFKLLMSASICRT